MFTVSAVLAALAAGTPAAAQLAPPSTGGYAEFDHLLQRLTEPRRVLVIGAHPDDEDTGLLTLMSRGRGAETAYLSLSRGEGGQNGIGPELGIALGLIRTRELEAARAIDGAQQFFTRAYDFGYTRSLEETERFWLPDTILKDVVRIVRRFRPHVIVSVFSGTARDGHGQHQMAGVMARRAWDVAGETAVYPELASEEGLAPWTPLKLYRSTRFDRDATTLTLELGGIDPRVGRTYRQIAAESRSQHRSQDFGSLQPLGAAETRLQLLETRVEAAPGADIFAGIPVEAHWLTVLADSLRRHVSASTMHAAVPALAGALARLGAPEPLALTLPRTAVPPRVVLVHRALAVAADVAVDAFATAGTIVPGDTVPASVTVSNAGSASVALHVAGVDGDIGAHRIGYVGLLVPAGTDRTLEVPLDALVRTAPSQPYFLAAPLRGAMYDWRAVPPPLRGASSDPPELCGVFVLEIAGAGARLGREAAHRLRHQAVGEIRRPIRIVPRIDVRLAPERVVWSSLAANVRTLAVTARNNGRDTTRAEVRLELDGWPAPPPRPVDLPPGESREVVFTVQRPAGVERASVTARAVARSAAGQLFTEGVEVVDYPHIRLTQWVRPAEAEIVVAPIAAPEVGRVGYIRGASDRVPEALADIGLPLEVIGPDTLARGDLSRFDVIVVGSRAYETDSALTTHNGRLLAWIRAGGHLVVQYQQYDFVRGGYAPYPLSIGSPHDRITDETAPVRLLVPGHPVFQAPNRIGPEDWEGWIQERGLYFPGEWAPEYTPLLEMQDPGRPPYRGALLIARYGAGTYIHTGISFFRELPAGIPGAFRLFFNLLAWDGADAGG